MPKFAWPWTRKKLKDSDKEELGLKNILKSVTDEIVARQQSIKDGSEGSIFFIEKADSPLVKCC